LRRQLFGSVFPFREGELFGRHACWQLRQASINGWNGKGDGLKVTTLVLVDKSVRKRGAQTVTNPSCPRTISAVLLLSKVGVALLASWALARCDGFFRDHYKARKGHQVNCSSVCEANGTSIEVKKQTSKKGEGGTCFPLFFSLVFPPLSLPVLSLPVEPTKACGIFLLSWFVCIPSGATHSQNYGCDGSNNCEKSLGNEFPFPLPPFPFLSCLARVVSLSRIDYPLQPERKKE
jgi:hypothetical protein